MADERSAFIATLSIARRGIGIRDDNKVLAFLKSTTKTLGGVVGKLNRSLKDKGVDIGKGFVTAKSKASSVWSKVKAKVTTDKEFVGPVKPEESPVDTRKGGLTSTLRRWATSIRGMDNKNKEVQDTNSTLKNLTGKVDIESPVQYKLENYNLANLPNQVTGKGTTSNYGTAFGGSMSSNYGANYSTSTTEEEPKEEVKGLSSRIENSWNKLSAKVNALLKDDTNTPVVNAETIEESRKNKDEKDTVLLDLVNETRKSNELLEQGNLLTKEGLDRQEEKDEEEEKSVKEKFLDIFGVGKDKLTEEQKKAGILGRTKSAITGGIGSLGSLIPGATIAKRAWDRREVEEEDDTQPKKKGIIAKARELDKILATALVKGTYRTVKGGLKGAGKLGLMGIKTGGKLGFATTKGLLGSAGIIGKNIALSPFKLAGGILGLGGRILGIGNRKEPSITDQSDISPEDNRLTNVQNANIDSFVEIQRRIAEENIAQNERLDTLNENLASLAETQGSPVTPPGGIREWWNKRKDRKKARQEEVEQEKKEAKERLGKDTKPSWITKLLSGLSKWFLPITAGFGFLKNYFANGGLKNLVKGAVKGIGRGLWWVVDNTARLVGRGLSNLGTFIASKFSKAITGLGSSIRSIISGLGTKITSAIVNVGTKFKSFFTSILNKIPGVNIGKNIAKAGSAIGKTIATKASSTVVRKIGLRAGLSIAAKVAGGVLSGPVGWTILAGSLAYDAYSLYKWYTDKPEWSVDSEGNVVTVKFEPEEPLPDSIRLRFMAYGTSSEDSVLSEKLINLESMVVKLIKFDKSTRNVEVKEIDDETQEQALQVFDVDSNDTAQVAAFKTWWLNRFLPAYTNYFRAISIVEDSKLNTDKEKAKVLVANFYPNISIFEVKELPDLMLGKGVDSSAFLNYKKELSRLLGIGEERPVEDKGLKATARTKHRESSSIALPPDLTVSNMIGNPTMQGTPTPYPFTNTYEDNLAQAVPDNSVPYSFPKRTDTESSVIQPAGEATSIGMIGSKMDPKEAVAQASKMTGVDNDMLLTFAKLESGLNPRARPFDPKTKRYASSASGLFQFLDATWKDTVSKYGKRYGLTLSNADRFNPLHSAVMGAELLKSTAGSIKEYINTNIPKGIAYYLAHFLGPGGARSFISKYKSNPNAHMANVVSNNVYNANKPSMGDRTASQFIDGLVKRWDTAAGTTSSYQSVSNSNKPIMMRGVPQDPTMSSSTSPDTSPDTSAASPASTLASLAYDPMKPATVSTKDKTTTSTTEKTTTGAKDTTYPITTSSSTDTAFSNTPISAATSSPSMFAPTPIIQPNQAPVISTVKMESDLGSQTNLLSRIVELLTDLNKKTDEGNNKEIKVNVETTTPEVHSGSSTLPSTPTSTTTPNYPIPQTRTIPKSAVNLSRSRVHLN